ncbi:MAG: inositol monophosphatase [Roseicyclus sp.]|jgi:myo-inositol-1(or 4)-monophosphatase|nr:inositol monophosphatase [Roseicyclus sp.]
MDVTDLKRRLDVVEATLAEAGQAALIRFRARDYEVNAKGRQDLVSDVDRETETALREALARAFPDTGFYGEESGGAVGDLTWVVDPIDGTSNFVRGVPHWCLSVGLLHRGRPVLGVIRDPNMNETFTGIAGAGARLNGQPIRVSAGRPLSEATLGLGFNLQSDRVRHAALIGRLLARDCLYRFMGSGALGLAWAAAGRTDGFWEERIMPWDVAAGLAIAEAAGACVSDYWSPECWAVGNSVLVASSGLAPAFAELACSS